MQYYSISKEEWDNAIENLLLSYVIFASVSNESCPDYEFISSENISLISYNHPRPATSLKSFYLPVKENVTSMPTPAVPRIIIGVPSCDIEALSILDSIYLDREFTDTYYKERRDNTILISSDCFGKNESCHCLSYGIKPYAEDKADMAIAFLNNEIILRTITEKGRNILARISHAVQLQNDEIIKEIDEKHRTTEAQLRASVQVPDYRKTSSLVDLAEKETWKKFSAHCVSCGACAAICPTCSCFLLIDKPGFEKIRQMDSCQYPGFERVAGGEDALFGLPDRFRNRYMCKYHWRPQKFDSIACTGCGRCIDACIGKINKNELIAELAEKEGHD